MTKTFRGNKMETKLTPKQIEFIKKLSKEMNTQDTRFTAQPYALVLREEVIRPIPNGYGDELIAYWQEEEYSEWDEFIEALKEYYEYGADAASDYTCENEVKSIVEQMSNFQELQNSSEADKIDCTVLNVKIEKEIKENNANFFFTEKAYNEYIKRNGHNLNKHDSYGIHLYRNREMEQLIEVIHTLARSL